MTTIKMNQSNSLIQGTPKRDIGYRVFAYIRRSTANKQELSLQRQEDSAQETITGNGYRENEVTYFIESTSAYNGVTVKNGIVTRRRVQFTKLLKEIDESPLPVILLTYEDSRLSRNDPDSTEILARLFAEYEYGKQKIAKIVFNGGETWTQDSNRGDIKQRLLDRYKESSKIGDRSKKATLRELRKGRYILSTPRGIDRLLKGEKTLRINSDMPYIVTAWEMRANGKSKIEITKYLKNYGITIGNSFEQYFQSLIYVGYWEDTETGELIKQRFHGGQPPLSMDIYKKVQGTLIKNTGTKAVSKYGTKQEGDIVAKLLKWETDSKKAFSVEFPKGKYRSYKSNAFGVFNKSESKILKDFITQTSPIFKKMVDKILILFIIKRGIGDSDFREKIQIIIKDCEGMNSDEEALYFVRKLGEVIVEDQYVDQLLSELKNNNKDYTDDLSEMISIYFEEIAKKNNQLDTDERELLIEKLEKDINIKESGKNKILVNALKNGYTAEIAQLTIDEVDEEIKDLQGQIDMLSQSTDMEEFIRRLPEILVKIFELSSNLLPVKEIEVFKSDLLKLIELTTFELSIDTKKELTVKLFEGLEDVLKLRNNIWLPELDSNQGPTG